MLGFYLVQDQIMWHYEILVLHNQINDSTTTTLQALAIVRIQRYCNTCFSLVSNILLVLSFLEHSQSFGVHFSMFSALSNDSHQSTNVILRSTGGNMKSTSILVQAQLTPPIILKPRLVLVSLFPSIPPSTDLTMWMDVYFIQELFPCNPSYLRTMMPAAQWTTKVQYAWLQEQLPEYIQQSARDKDYACFWPAARYFPAQRAAFPHAHLARFLALKRPASPIIQECPSMSIHLIALIAPIPSASDAISIV
ncbi:hypothetical protein DFJ58DRAFT_841623 [Suillus subalutaceus]|uniref:uncharacterized protein n=1 Tax=Suillus subalutaceus TaxID=48586 RepID=UPI001B8799B5|nr:uncharacterized protein DFJ58DRAFT_841623 [Suillus subalutaceus]KAG1853438.1 hypothetical protein DFJ58DRAFT_841623 [Suillus subalutaceus]